MARDPFRDGTVWAWLLAAAIVVCGVLWLLSCAGCASPPPPLPPEKVDVVVACQRAIAGGMQKATCPEAQLAINADEACHLLFPRGLSLDCKEFRR